MVKYKFRFIDPKNANPSQLHDFVQCADALTQSTEAFSSEKGRKKCSVYQYDISSPLYKELYKNFIEQLDKSR